MINVIGRLVLAFEALWEFLWKIRIEIRHTIRSISPEPVRALFDISAIRAFQRAVANIRDDEGRYISFTGGYGTHHSPVGSVQTIAFGRTTRRSLLEIVRAARLSRLLLRDRLRTDIELFRGVDSLLGGLSVWQWRIRFDSRTQRWYEDGPFEKWRQEHEVDHFAICWARMARALDVHDPSESQQQVRVEALKIWSRAARPAGQPASAARIEEYERRQKRRD